MRRVFNIIIYIFAVIGLVLCLGYVAIRLHLTNTSGIIEGDQNRYLKSDAASSSPTELATLSALAEWQTFKAAISKDRSVLARVENETGVSARLIMAVTAAEQLRLYYDNREVYKKIFEPLKILGSESQFSWGVTGIKEETAVKIEENLKELTSLFYPGTAYEHLLDFQTSDHDTERFNRIIDEHNHYYSYLYAALYIKEVDTQWQKAGFNISNNIGVLATRYDIGFQNSKPKAAPQVGGAAITIDGKTYSFGGLAYSIYYSNELLENFPRK